jgi:DNA-binding SARP family transcriptional activator
MLSPDHELYDPSSSNDTPPNTPAEQVETTQPNDLVLLTAREHASLDDLPRALHAYRHLLRRGRVLDEIIPDLARLVKTYPQDVRLWETLGDALALSGNPDHAAKAYAQAEKLMR